MISNEYGEMIQLLIYYESGKLQSVANYSNGLHGPNIHFFENGDTLMYFNYNHGVPDGRAYCYYSKNKLAYELFFKDGYKSGTWKYYNEGGTLRNEEVYEDGKSIPYQNKDFATAKYYQSNNLAFTTLIRNGVSSDTVIVDQAGFEALMPDHPATGKQLFLQNCASCHHPTKDATGPMLKGVAQKRETEWLTKMILNGAELIQKKDPLAMALYLKWGKISHPGFTDQLTQEQALLIISYIRSIK